MDLKLIYALILTILPITELRVGMPIAMAYALESGFPVHLIFVIIVLLNIALIWFIFFFLDYLHHYFMKIKAYRRLFEFYLRRIRKKAKKIEDKYKSLEYLALVLFVAIPLPGTGAWTGCLLSWLLGLDRKRSILSIATGVLIAGTIIFIASLGVISLF